MRIPRIAAWSGGAVLAAALLGGCAATPSGSAEPSGTAWTPQWFDPDEMPEATSSFEDGPALAAATGVRFRNDLGDVYDWETVGEPTETTTELVNTGNGCHTLDEKAPYTGAEADDRSASTALAEALLADAELLAGPDRGIWGLGEGLGEGGPTYDAVEAIGHDAEGRYVFVTARVFTALGVQHSITVTCDVGQELSRTRSQLKQVAYAYIAGLPHY